MSSWPLTGVDKTAGLAENHAANGVRVRLRSSLVTASKFDALAKHLGVRQRGLKH